jgi:ABC-2 type transport system permease protein
MEATTIPIRRAGALKLVAHETRYDLLTFWRSPASRFFTLILPVVFLVVFASVFGDGAVQVDGRSVPQAVYYVGHITALGVISASFVNLVITVTIERESGVLKRRRATPLPAWVVVTGRALTSVVVAVGIVALLLAVARIGYGVTVSGEALVALALSTVVGAAAFCCLGFALTSVIGSAEAANPVVQAMLLPLYFISGVFVPREQIPQGLQHIADAFPVSHLADALYAPLDPATTGFGVDWVALLIVAAWGLAGLVVAVRRFSWGPRGR